MLDHPIKPLHKDDVKHLQNILGHKLDIIFGWAGLGDVDKAEEVGNMKGMIRLLGELGYMVRISVSVEKEKELK